MQNNGIAISNGQKCQSLALNFRYFCIFCVDPMHRFMTEIMIQKANVTATPTGTPPSPSGSLRVMCGCISPQTAPKTPMGSEAFTPQQPCQTRVRYCTIQNEQGFVRHCFVGDILKILVNPWLLNLCCWGCIFEQEWVLHRFSAICHLIIRTMPNTRRNHNKLKTTCNIFKYPVHQCNLH